MIKKNSATTSQQQGHTLFRIFKYIKRNPLPIMLLAFSLVVFLYLMNMWSTKDAYGTDRIKEESTNVAYNISTYDEYGKVLSTLSSSGVNLTVDHYSDDENNKKVRHDLIRLDTSKGYIETSSSYLVAYPKSLKPIKHKDDEDPYANGLVKNNGLGYSKILVIKTEIGKPIIAFSGYSIQQKYCDINNSEVFVVDNRLIYVYKGEFSIIDGSLF